MKKLLILFLFPLLLLTGCAPAIYSGPSGASFEDFAKARHMCYTSLSKESSGYIDIYGGSYNEAVSCGAFTSCLASKGYRENPNGGFSAEGISINCK
jgi:hypothetical protein